MPAVCFETCLKFLTDFKNLAVIKFAEFYELLHGHSFLEPSVLVDFGHIYFVAIPHKLISQEFTSGALRDHKTLLIILSPEFYSPNASPNFGVVCSL
jgi:hypothetical protein